MKSHVCPWYIGYFLASPLRRFCIKPEKILAPYVKPGMTVLEVGPGMGFFTLPLTNLVGEFGRVICIDIQEKMLKSLKKRAYKAGLLDQIEARLCTGASLGIVDLKDKIDFVLAFAVIHEVPNQKNLFKEIFDSLKIGRLVLIAEPSVHVTKSEFDETISVAKETGFKIVDSLKIKHYHSVILQKLQYFIS